VAAIGLRTGQSYGEAGREVLHARTTELFARAELVAHIDEPERVHRMRVATRRLRAALEVFEDCFPPKRVSEARAEVKELADALGQRRDCDVLIDLLESLAPAAGRAERSTIDQLVHELRDEQVAANELLSRALAHARDIGLEQRLRSLAE